MAKKVTQFASTRTPEGTLIDNGKGQLKFDFRTAFVDVLDSILPNGRIGGVTIVPRPGVPTETTNAGEDQGYPS